ncbi:S8 family peptidase [Glycomyces albidus]|nr:S8 family serine peptidase [Glycomyces albidus]
MAIPLTPPSAEPRSPRRGLRTALAAGLTTLAATAAVTAAPGVALAQGDPFFTENAWVTDQIQAAGAWENSQGEGITVAVMDTGVGQHPVFDGKDVLPGFSLYSDEPDGRIDNHGHGTAIAAGVLLAAPEATIMPVRFYTGVESGFGGVWGEAQYDAFRRVADEGADIVVLPWSLEGNENLLPEDLEALQYVIDKGAIVIAGAGNDAESGVANPAAVPGVVAVTGTRSDGSVWSDVLSTGPEVALAAPADEMTVPLPQTDSLGDSELHELVSGGTSMASAITAGVAALTWAAHPDLDASNVIQRLLQTAGDGNGDRDDVSGFGLLNADQAVNAEGIEPVEENPLGYPMGEAGASGATPDDTPSEGAEEEPGAASPGGPSAAAEGNKESNLSAIIVVAAAVVLLGAAAAVWLVLRGRGRKAAQSQQPPGSDPTQVGYQQPAAATQQYVPPMGGQGYGGPPGQQGYSSPPQGFSQPGSPTEPSPPWRPDDRNQR